jgi:site-specific DNA-cytosine methylase
MLQTIPDIYLAEGLAPRAQNAPPRQMGPQGSPLGASTATDLDSSAVGDGSVTAGPLPGQAVRDIPASGASAHDILYDDAAQFTPEMDELNRLLYTFLNNSYVGSKGTKLPYVPEAYRLFHYAMLHLWSMEKKNTASRKIQAVEAFNKTLIVLTEQLNILNSSEDPSEPQTWETNLAPVIDYLGTYKAVLNGNTPAQAVAAPVQAVAAPGPPPAVAKAAPGPPPGMTWSTKPKDITCVNMVCGNCKQPNHHRRKNCPMGHLDSGPACDYCHNKGHKSDVCRKKLRDEKKSAACPTLFQYLLDLDAKQGKFPINYVRSGEEVRRIPDTDPVTLSELHSGTDQDKDEDDICPDRESDCPSHGLVQEGRSNSRSDQVAQEALQKRFEDDLRRLMALTYEQPSEEIDIPEGSATSELSTPPTEEMRNATVFTTKSDLTEDLNGNKKRIDLESISPASPQGTIIMNPSSTLEPPAPSTKEALEQYAEVVPPENPDEFPNALEQLTAKNKQLEADLQAYKDLYPVPPSITDLLETPEDMVKIIGQGASQKGKSWSDTPGLPTATLPVSIKTPDLVNIIKEVNTTSADQHKSPAIIEEGPLRAKSEAGNIINAPSAPIYNVGDAEPDRGTQFIVLSLCDGLGCAAIAMQKAGIPITRYCAVELNSKARSIASHASPKTDLFPGVDHSVANDINDITEKDIAAFPRNSIKWLVGGPECSDFSKLRLLPPSEAFVKDREKQARDSGGKYIPQSYPRKGLDGDKGKTFRTCIKIWGWVKKYHPDCAYLFENVVFNDMDADWREVCEALGEPVIIDSHDYSAASRRRAWWHNNPTLQNDPEQWMGDLKPIDPQTCMDPGRTVDTYEAKGKTKVRTIGASWGGDPQNPQQQSRRKVWVHDAAFPGQPQELRITEAEKLLGMEPGTTSAPGLAPLDRLKAVGGGWDVRIATRLFKTLSQGSPQPIGYTTAQVREKALGLPQRLTKDHLMAVEDYKEMSPGAVDKLSAELQAFYVALLQHSDAPCAASIDAPCAASVNMVLHGSVIDSGASKHVCKSIEIEDGTRSTRLVGFDGSQKWTEGKGYLPIQTLTQSGNAVHLDINDADQFSSAETNLLSMGKLVVQDNWVVHCSKSETYATLPDGERVDLYFNEENVLCFKHDLRTGQGALRIPGSSTAFLTRFADVRAGSHKRDSAQSQCNTISSYNAYSVLQSEDSYDDQGLMIDDGQEW